MNIAAFICLCHIAIVFIFGHKKSDDLHRLPLQIFNRY